MGRPRRSSDRPAGLSLFASRMGSRNRDASSIDDGRVPVFFDATDEKRVASPFLLPDRYWGDGGDCRGKNMLGKILMWVREELGACGRER